MEVEFFFVLFFWVWVDVFSFFFFGLGWVGFGWGCLWEGGGEDEGFVGFGGLLFGG